MPKIPPRSSWGPSLIIMATLPQLMSPAEDDSSEDSFDHVSDNFDGEYEELTGRATGDYVPGQKDEVAIREGICSS